VVRKKAGTTKRTRPRKAPPPAPLAPSRERILNAAFSSFTEKGYARTSTLEIATRAKVSKRELYALCTDKSALLRDAVTERAKRMRLALELPAAEDREALATTLTAFGNATLRGVCDKPVLAVYRLPHAEARTPPGGAALLADARGDNPAAP